MTAQLLTFTGGTVFYPFSSSYSSFSDVDVPAVSLLEGQKYKLEYTLHIYPNSSTNTWVFVVGGLSDVTIDGLSYSYKDSSHFEQYIPDNPVNDQPFTANDGENGVLKIEIFVTANSDTTFQFDAGVSPAFGITHGSIFVINY